MLIRYALNRHYMLWSRFDVESDAAFNRQHAPTSHMKMVETDHVVLDLHITEIPHA